MTNHFTWVGLDAHKKWINVATLVPGREEPLTWQEANEESAIRRLARRLGREAPFAPWRPGFICCASMRPSSLRSPPHGTRVNVTPCRFSDCAGPELAKVNVTTAPEPAISMRHCSWVAS